MPLFTGAYLRTDIGNPSVHHCLVVTDSIPELFSHSMSQIGKNVVFLGEVNKEKKSYDNPETALTEETGLQGFDLVLTSSPMTDDLWKVVGIGGTIVSPSSIEFNEKDLWQ